MHRRMRRLAAALATVASFGMGLGLGLAATEAAPAGAATTTAASSCGSLGCEVETLIGDTETVLPADVSGFEYIVVDAACAVWDDLTGQQFEFNSCP